MSAAPPAERMRPRDALVAAAGLVVARAVSSGLTVVAAALLSRWWSPEIYGRYQQVWLFYATAAPFAMMGLPASMGYYVPRTSAREQKALVLQTAGMLALGGALAGEAIWLLGRHAADRGVSEDLATALALFSLFPVLSLPLSFVEDLLVARGQARSAAAVAVATASTHVAAVVVPAGLGYGLTGVVFGLVVAAGLRLILVGACVMRSYAHVALAWSWALLANQVRYAMPLGLAGVVGSLTLQIDRIWVASFFGPKSYAVYANAATEVPLVGIVTATLVSVLTPEFVRLWQAERRHELLALWHSATRAAATVMFPVAALSVVFSTDMMTVVFSARYAESGVLFAIFSLLVPLRITVYGMLLRATGHARTILLGAVGALGLKVILNAALCPVVGMVGAALATVASTYMFAGWQLHMCARVVGVGWKRIFPWRALGHTGRSAALAAAAAWTASHAFASSAPRLAVGAGVLAGSYSLLAWWTRGHGGIIDAHRVVLSAEADDAPEPSVHAGHAS